MNKRFTLGVALVATLSIFGTSVALAQDEDPAFSYELDPLHASDFGVVPNSELVDGQPLTYWVEQIDDWFALTPFDEHPGPQNDCQAAQGGPVFFLSNVRFGTTQIYDCEIGVDQYVLVAIGGGFGFGDEPGDTPEAMYKLSLDNSMMLWNPELILDGRWIPVGGSTWFQREAFPLELPEGNLFGAPAGPYTAISNGWYMMLEPLSPGQHSIIVRDDTLQPVISTQDVGVGNVVADDPSGVGETITATAVFNITVPEPEAAAE